MQNIYGVTDSNNIHTDVATSLHATKIHATKNNYDTISIRYNCGYIAVKKFTKVGNKWKTIDS
jgi:hypothetical protein